MKKISRLQLHLAMKPPAGSVPSTFLHSKDYDFVRVPEGIECTSKVPYKVEQMTVTWGNVAGYWTEDVADETVQTPFRGTEPAPVQPAPMVSTYGMKDPDQVDLSTGSDWVETPHGPRKRGDAGKFTKHT
jgi:hypothetical protein